MVVADLRAEGILGLDFLETNQCAIDLPQEIMKLRGSEQSIPLYRITNMKDRKCDKVSVVLANDIYISGNAEMELEAVIQGEVASGTMMIERRALTQKPSILLATSVVNVHANATNPMVPIRLMNLSPDRITMGKGTRVASASTLDITSIVVAGVDCKSPAQSEVSDEKQQRLRQAVESAAGKLTQQEQEQLFAVLLNNADVFADDASDLGKTDEFYHTINTGNALPIRQPARRLPAAQQEVHKLLGEMEKKRIILPSKVLGHHQSCL